MKRLLDIALVAVTVSSVTVVFLAREAWVKVFYDLGVGALITVFFYLLVVRLPDHQRRQRLKKSLEKHYKFFREDCIEIMLSVADGGYMGDLPETLMEQDKFRDYFQQKTAAGRDRLDEFQNNLDKYNLSELLTRMEIFRDELIFVLNNVDIPKDGPFEFLKRLSANIYAMKDVTIGYDEKKRLTNFLWDVLAGGDPVTGYREEDIVKKMINAI